MEGLRLVLIATSAFQAPVEQSTDVSPFRSISAMSGCAIYREGRSLRGGWHLQNFMAHWLVDQVLNVLQVYKL